MFANPAAAFQRELAELPQPGGAGEVYRSDRPSASTWFLVALMITALASFRTRPADEIFGAEAIDGQVIFQLLCWLVFGLVLMAMSAAARIDWRLITRGPLLWYGGFAVIAVGSVLYSPSPAMSGYRAVQLLVLIGLVASLGGGVRYLYHFSALYTLMNLAFLGANLCGAGLQATWVPWAEGDSVSILAQAGEGVWRFQSWFGHPSQIGVVGAMTVVGLLAKVDRKNAVRWAPIIGLTAFAVLITVSRTAIAGMAGGVLVVCLYRRRLPITLCAVGFVACLFALSDSGQDVVLRYLARGQSSDDLASFTGRDEVYADAIAKIGETGVLGNGFVANRKDLLVESKWGGVTHAHNLFLEATLSLGVLGLLAVSGVLVAAVALAVKLIRFPAVLRADDTDPDGPTDRAYIARPQTVGWELAAMLVPLTAFCLLDTGYSGTIQPFIVFMVLAFAYAQAELLLAREQLADAEVEDERAHILPFRRLGGEGATP
jgi:O-antigen ligase